MGLFSKKKKETDIKTDDREQKTSSLYMNKKKPKFAAIGKQTLHDRENYVNIRNAVKELGFNDSVAEVFERGEVSSYGFVDLPAFAINGKVVWQGGVISQSTARNLIVRSGLKP